MGYLTHKMEHQILTVERIRDAFHKIRIVTTKALDSPKNHSFQWFFRWWQEVLQLEKINSAVKRFDRYQFIEKNIFK